MNRPTLDKLNRLDPPEVEAAFLRCCGARAWARRMAALRPFADDATLAKATRDAFAQLDRDDWLEAFGHHPPIGDLNSLRARFAGNREWSAGEQSGTSTADERTLRELADANQRYVERFGYTFIVCATGKSAGEMLALLKRRLSSGPQQELEIAAGEQRKITALRLQKLELP